MKELKSLYAMTGEDPLLARYFQNSLLEGGILEEELNFPFIDIIGGSVFMVQTPEEIDRIPAISDYEGFIPSQEYYEIRVITNDLGGNVYFIPEELYTKYLFYSQVKKRKE
jgi:hypothetical protein